MSRIASSSCSRRGRALLLAGAVTLVSPAAAEAAAKRIVALTPFSANTMALLEKRPVAIGQVASGETTLWDKRLAQVPRLPLTHPAGPNLEQLARLRADLVFTADAWQRGTPGMRRLGLRVADREPERVADVPRQSERIGRLIGKASLGKRLAKIQRQQIKEATRKIKRRPSVLLVLGVGDAPYAFLPNSWGGDLVQRAGGRLITGGLKNSSGYARISDEFVVARNPDVIIAVPHGNPKNIERIAANLRNRPGWRTTRAARGKRVYISTNNVMLQPIVGTPAALVAIRKSYLRNW